MKPQKLLISAFGPYSEQVVIDFTKFGGKGLFLITGNTGAGKTTIFDAVCYALYGKASGSYRTGEMLRSDFAKPTVPTNVQLTFEHNKEIYVVERNPKYNRPSKRGNGETTQTANAALTMPTGKVVTGTGEVTKYIEDILKVDYDRFTQIVMIAQGDFLRLLLANSKERGEIFRNIFNTSVYVRFQEKLKQMLKEQYDNRNQTKTRVLQEISAITISDDNIKNQLQALKSEAEYKIDEIKALLHSAIQLQSEQLNNINKKIDKQREVKQELEKVIDTANENNKSLIDLEKGKQRLQTLKAKENEVKELSYKTEQANILLKSIVPVDNRYLELKDEHDRLKQTLSKKMQQLQKNKAELTAVTEQLNNAKKHEPQKEEQKVQIIKLQQQQSSYDNLENVKEEINRLNKELADVDKALSDSVKNIEINTKEKDNLTEKINCLAEAPVWLEKTKAQADNTQKNIDSLKKLQSLLNEFNEKNKEKAQLQKKFLELDREYKVNSDKFRILEDKFYRAQAGILAEKLEEGKRCPVCGSIMHPFPAQRENDVPSKEQLDNQSQALDNKREKRNNCSEEIQVLNNFINMLKNNIDEYYVLLNITDHNADIKSVNSLLYNMSETQKNLLVQSKQFSEAVKQLKICKENLQSVTEKLNIAEKDRQELKQKKAALSSTVKEKTLQYDELKKNLEYSSKAELVNKIKSLKNIVEEFEQQLNTAQKNYDNVQNSVTAINAEIKQVSKMKDEKKEQALLVSEEIKKLFKKHNINSYDEFKHKKLTEEQIKENELYIKQYNENLAVCKNTVDLLVKSLKNTEFTNVDVLQEKLKVVVDELSVLEKNKLALHSEYSNNINIEVRLTEEAKKLTEQTNELAIIKNLCDTANGNLTGKEKIAFEQYIQGAYFQQIISQANIRLSAMTNDRYELVHKTSGGSLNTRSGLELDVLDHYTNRVRSVKSLSGGESFKASLSMALGLSDVVQRQAGGVQIDAMFVDEGFGSLDDESLNSAINILNGLTYGNRLVGIISHVNELKSSIDNKIIVKASPTGSSVTIQT